MKTISKGMAGNVPIYCAFDQIISADELKPNPKNPNQHPPEQIALLVKVIEKRGWRTPVTVSNLSGLVVRGHGRLMAAKQLGCPVPVDYQDYSDENDELADLLADNKIAELAEIDNKLLADVFAEIDVSAIDISTTGYSEQEYNSIVSALTDSLQMEDHSAPNEDVPVSPSKPITRPGDIYLLGRHRLMCGDSTSKEMFAVLMNGKTARLCVTSPPYGVGMEYEEKGIEPWRRTISGVISTITNFCRIICWNIGDLFATDTQFIEPTSMYSTQYMQQNGFDILYSRIWKKQGANFNGVNPYHLVSMKPVQEYEWILGYGKKDYEKDYAPIQKYMKDEFDKSGISKGTLAEITGAKHMYGHWFTPNQWNMIDESNYVKIQKYCQKNNINAFCEEYAAVRRRFDDLNIYQKTLTDEDRSAWGQWAIWDIPTVQTRDGHPAAYPIELPSRLIKMHTREGDNVIEPFCGSGTTMIACEQLNRTCFGMEFEPRYCDVIVKRYALVTGKRDITLIRDGNEIPVEQTGLLD